MKPGSAKNINENSHEAGMWATSICSAQNNIIRAYAGYLSLKRKGVADLSRTTINRGFVLDAGAGQGAYSIWYATAKKSFCKVISVDISFSALRRLQKNRDENDLTDAILPVCADMTALPFKHTRFVAAFSVDALGHVDNVDSALNELLRCVCPNAGIFLHSECNDYKSRWPDRMLIKTLGKDVVAEVDHHTGQMSSQELFKAYSRRFTVLSFVNPAGYLGWLIGYPEKYREAFALSRHPILSRIVGFFAAIKGMWGIGMVVRLKNALSNHLENFLGLTGGGSCFAHVKKPQ